MAKKLPPIHPGEILLEEFLKPMGITPYRVAKDLKIPANRVTGIVNEQRAITADTAVLFGHYFGTSSELWMNLQTRYDLRIAQREAEEALSALPTVAMKEKAKLEREPSGRSAATRAPRARPCRARPSGGSRGPDSGT